MPPSLRRTGQGMSWLVPFRLGLAWHGGRGSVRSGKARRGPLRQGWARLGVSWQARPGRVSPVRVRQGAAWLGKAGRRVSAGPGKACHGTVRPGKARPG